MKKNKGRFVAIIRFLGVLVMSLGLSACLAPSPESVADQPRAAAGWGYEIFASDISYADNIVIGGNGEIFVSLENKAGVGQVIRLKDGQRQVIADGLNRPDGLALSGSDLYITEEVPAGRLIRVDLTDLSQTVLAKLERPEGVDIASDGSVVIAEDSQGGRLIRIGNSGRIDLLAQGFDRPEGLSIAPDGRIYLAETNAGRIIELTDGRARTLVEGLNKPDQVGVARDGAVWITEDQKPGRLLRFYQGRLEVVVEGLMAPQGIAFDAKGQVYVSEQGRHRILLVRRSAD